MEKTADFYKLAEAYCRYVAENEISNDSAPFLMKLLMELYLSALNLPESGPETIDHSSSDLDEHADVRISDMIHDRYWEVFDPYIQEEPVCGSLADDLSDIAADLQRGIKEYDSGRIGNAVFEWKFGLNSHWGNHAVNALRVLHAIRTR